MTELLVVLIAGVAAIAVTTVLGSRLGVASPLLLVAVGVAASIVPGVGEVVIEPDWILEGLLPPLLSAAAVSMPPTSFRREFGAIGGLSVLLVVATSLILGVFFEVAIPGLGFGWGVALGAVVSPTDAVAVSIIRRTPVSQRVVTMLDGESLLNDATALVVLRTAVGAASLAAFSFWSAVGTFAWSVVVAVLVGWLVGRFNLAVRARIGDPTVGTVISFAVPFAASLPAELLGGSGLVAAVVAGLVTGVRGPHDLSPMDRLSDSWNWRTVGLALEGAVFLTMGLQVTAVVSDVEREHAGVGTAVLVATGALAITLLARAAYVAPLLLRLGRRARRGERLQDRLLGLQDKLTSDEGREAAFREMTARPGRSATQRDLDRFARRITRVLADIDYFLREPLGWRDGLVVVWAGMRGAITVAAAQTLPEETPQRALLVLVAFTVATLSLLLQGGTVATLVRRTAGPPDPAAAEHAAQQRARLLDLLREAADAVPEPPRADGERSFPEEKRFRIEVLDAQREALLEARATGRFDADVLASTLANLDASQIAIEMRGGRGT